MSEKGGQFTSSGGGSGGGSSGGGGARPKVSEVSTGRTGWLGREREPIKPSAKAMAGVNKAVDAMPAQHAALLKDVKVQVYARSHDIKFNGEAGFTHVYDKANNTISVADTFDPTYLGDRRIGGRVASVEHNTMQALAAALDDKLDGAGHRAMIDAFRSERGPLTPRATAYLPAGSSEGASGGGGGGSSMAEVAEAAARAGAKPNSAEKKALNWIESGGNYGVINRWLRGLFGSSSPEQQQTVKTLDNYLNRQSMPNDETVSRGVGVPWGQQLENMEAGFVIHDRGFVSTSKNQWLRRPTRKNGDDVLEGQKTMFVELYSVAYSPDNSYDQYSGSMTRDRAAKVFAPELAKIKKLAM